MNLRYGPIGVSVAPALAGPWWSRLLRAQLVVDETWALSADGRGGHDAKIIVGAGVVLYAAWVVGTVVGVLFGDDRRSARWGLDAAFPALFLALVPNLDRPHAKQAAILGAAIALALTPIAPPASRSSPRTRLPDRVEALVNDAWWTVVLVGTATIAIKGRAVCWAAGRSPSGSAA